MVFENLEVMHKTFGDGTVTSKNGKYMTVKFSSSVKTFVYPDAFESFLTLRGGVLNPEIEADIQSARSAKQAIFDKKQEENMRAMTKGIVIPGKENAVSDSEEEESRFKSTEAEEI